MVLKPQAMYFDFIKKKKVGYQRRVLTKFQRLCPAHFINQRESEKIKYNSIFPCSSVVIMTWNTFWPSIVFQYAAFKIKMFCQDKYQGKWL